ncbi:Protein FAM24A [Heterocephalus glaber]|uniref:Protein FAM24A n=1 Tax=Heterocephalus glaber TaxID=10181 RepID=G5AKG2_HETGA|nr:Protein FAM24A [Heterocephalus glaber]
MSSMSATFDLQKILLIVSCGTMVAILVLIVVVIYLDIKLSKAMKASKECDPEANSATNTKNKVILAETAAVDSCPTFELCDECKMYADYDALPPCFCDINEGP